MKKEGHGQRDTPPPKASERILPITTSQKPGTFWGKGEAQLRTETLFHNPIITLQIIGAPRSSVQQHPKSGVVGDGR